MQDLIVGLVQTKQFWEDKSKNLDHFELLLDENIKTPIDLILLPEMFNTSFSMNVKNLAESIDGPSINWLIDQANKHQCQIGATLIIKENDNYYNRFVIISASGLQSSYNKRHLFRMAHENESFRSGEERVVFEIKGWRILLQVCYDLRFPVFSRNRVIDGKKEYDLSVYLANWPEKRAEIWKVLLQARAIENQSYSIGINRIGKDGNEITYSGDSMVVDPWGKIVEQCQPHQEIVKIVTLKRQTLDDITVRFPAFLDAD